MNGEVEMTEHDHMWIKQSSHDTSLGIVVYCRCACGAHSTVEYGICGWGRIRRSQLAAVAASTPHSASRVPGHALSDGAA
jgi:hypothetical protein